MDEDQIAELKDSVLRTLKADYYVINRNGLLSYTVNTFAAVLLVGGVTFVAVLATLYQGTAAATRAKIETTAIEVQKLRGEIAEGVFTGDVSISGRLNVQEIKVGGGAGIFMSGGDTPAFAIGYGGDHNADPQKFYAYPRFFTRIHPKLGDKGYLEYDLDTKRR